MGDRKEHRPFSVEGWLVWEAALIPQSPEQLEAGPGPRESPCVRRGQSWFTERMLKPGPSLFSLSRKICYKFAITTKSTCLFFFIKNVIEPIICVYVTAGNVVPLGMNNTPALLQQEHVLV